VLAMARKKPIKPRKKHHLFDPKKAPKRQLKARVDDACRQVLVHMAKGDLKKVTSKMVRIAAVKNNVPQERIVEHFEKLKKANHMA
jgi:hypothetical protein